MDNDLPDNFDLIVVGTGMIESIVAAAASRIGKNVLHVDNTDYYGGLWASFNLEVIDKYVINQVSSSQTVENFSQFLNENEQSFHLGNIFFGICDVSHKWHFEAESTEEEKKSLIDDIDKLKIKENEDWTQDKILNNSRKFNLDLAPKLQYARGDFVELLISSNIARYSEYRSVSRVLIWLSERLEVVPCSRSDVFSNDKVSVVEKRLLMKFLNDCMKITDEEITANGNKTFYKYLNDKNLTPELTHYILYAISMSDKTTPLSQGVLNTKRFLSSLGRFGKTPFIFSMYGSGELPQAFCRLCAVFGGTYCLNRPIKSIFINSSNECTGIVCGNQRINAKHFVMSIESIPEKFSSNWKREKISRAIFITDRSFFPTGKEELTLLFFPQENKNTVTVIELGPATGVCPQGLYVVHLLCKQQEDPEKDLEFTVQKLFKENENNPSCILWSLYYSAVNTYNYKSDELPQNIFPCNGPDLDLDYDESVKKAKDIFLEMFPGCEFLPRAPDPEEIILCDDDNQEIGNTIMDSITESNPVIPEQTDAKEAVDANH